MSFDKRIAEELEENETFQAIIAQLKEAATSTVTVTDRSASGCTRCGCKHFRTIEVPDHKTKLAIIQWLADRGVGKAAQVEGEDGGDRIVFERVVYMTDEPASS